MQYLVVDGYNIIGAWEDLRLLSLSDIAAARHSLYEALLNYCGYCGFNLVLVFDAYNSDEGERIEKHSKKNHHRIIYTKKGQTADQYIERFVRKNKGEIVVASSDALVQIMIFAYASRMSARELKDEVDFAQKEMDSNQAAQNQTLNGGLWKHLNNEIAWKLEQIRIGVTVNEEEKPIPAKNTSPVIAKQNNPKQKKRRKRRKTDQIYGKEVTIDEEKYRKRDVSKPKPRPGNDKEVSKRRKQDN